MAKTATFNFQKAYWGGKSHNGVLEKKTLMNVLNQVTKAKLHSECSSC